MYSTICGTFYFRRELNYIHIKIPNPLVFFFGFVAHQLHTQTDSQNGLFQMGIRLSNRFQSISIPSSPPTPGKSLYQLP
jgi:hypothetical protein